ncbi:hypothetical protein ABZV58_16445 [Nocardia sp. NPDC004654]|uniref:hypothetical protein n=1 Tax=Nocardia sp. NPDC004654 TaxID=3154776 RepID=UPI0033AD8672
MVVRVGNVGLTCPNGLDLAHTGGDQFTAQQGLERFGQLDVDMVLFEVDLLEECLVEQATDAGTCFQIARMTVAGVVERGAQIVLNDLDAEQASLQADLDPGQLVGDAVLFVFHEVERDRSGVVGLQQLRSFIEQALPLLLQVMSVAVGCLAADR